MTDDVLFDVNKGLGVITLNRPKALNSLNHAMVRAILDHLLLWKEDDSIKAVVVVGAGEKAFCAGGDIVTVVKDYQAGDAAWRAFFHDEYLMNIAIDEFPKPYIALVAGIAMGGGVGVSIPGDFWVATEKTLYAMPETGIGFFPDVGGGWFLPRLPGEIGTFLGLTGARLKQADLYALGMASHTVKSEDCPAIVEALAEADIKNLNDVRVVLDEFHCDPGPAPLAAVMDDIDHHFSGFTVEDIYKSLSEQENDWCQQQAEAIASKSPLALKVTFEQLKRGAGIASFRDNMIMEFRMVVRWMARGNFHEGVRALLIDKDNSPKWQPPTLTEVSEDSVEAFFVPFDSAAEELAL